MRVGGVGLVCPVGLDATTACAAMRAGVSRFLETPFFHSQGELVVASFAPELLLEMGQSPRLIEMLVLAVQECLGGRDAEAFDLPFMVALAETGRPGAPAELRNQVLSGLQERLNVRIDKSRSRVFTSGHTAGIEAMANARAVLGEGRARAVVVCAVDSYLTPDTLLWLETSWRLKTDETSDGVIPGEAAAAVLLLPEREENTCPVQVSGLGFARENGHVLSDEALRADGLTEAAQHALAEAGIDMTQVAFRLSDVTGEQYGFKEQAIALIRLLNQPVDEMPLWHSADSIGDVGAAAGICQLVVAYQAFLKGYAPGATAACFCSSVPGERAVMVLNGPPSPDSP